MGKNNAVKRAKHIKKIRLKKEKDVFMKFGAKLRAYLFTGILVTAPVAITFYVAFEIIKWMNTLVNKLLPPELVVGDHTPFTIPGLGFVVLIIIFMLIGMFTSGFVGRFFVRLGEWIVYKMPVISSIYSLLKQIFETFLSNNKQSFNKVVLLEYPRKGIWILGLVSGDTKGEVKKKLEDKMINVFIPTTPNPTSGFLIFVPEKDLTYLKMSVEDGIKFIISCGIVDPEEIKKHKK